MSHTVEIVNATPLSGWPRWRAACRTCGKVSDPWLDCDDARADLADKPCKAALAKAMR